MSKKITHTRELEDLIKNTIEVLRGDGDGYVDEVTVDLVNGEVNVAYAGDEVFAEELAEQIERAIPGASARIDGDEIAVDLPLVAPWAAAEIAPRKYPPAGRSRSASTPRSRRPAERRGRRSADASKTAAGTASRRKRPTLKFWRSFSRSIRTRNSATTAKANSSPNLRTTNLSPAKLPCLGPDAIISPVRWKCSEKLREVSASRSFFFFVPAGKSNKRSAKNDKQFGNLMTVV